MSCEQPKYKHDCKFCTFLGRTIGRGHAVDLYFHPAVGHLIYGSVIARFSDEGSDYVSCLIQYVHPEGHAELWAAKDLAIESGVQIKPL